MSAAPSSAPVQAPERLKQPPLHIEQPKPSRPWKWLVLLALVAAVAFGIWRATANKTETAGPAVPTYRTAKVTAGSVERVIRLAGQTAARNFATITAPILRGPEMRGNMVLLKLAPSGAYVKKGDVIAEIDAQSLQDHIDDLNDTVESAEADVRKRSAELQVEWENLQQTLRVSKSELDKAQLDYRAAEVRTDIEQQLLKLALDEAEAKYKQAQNDLTHKQASQKADLRILDITRERHQRHRDRHIGDLKRFTIVAPMDGLAVMNTIFRGGDMNQIKQGDQVFPGQQIMKVVDPSSMQVEASINQAESSEFKLGQRARVTLDGFPGVEVPARVFSVGALATRSWRENFYIRNIPVRLLLEAHDPRLIPDLSASAAVLIERADNSTVVPLAAVTQEGERAFAHVKTASGFDKRELKLGVTNGVQAAVLSGLNPGDEIRLN